MLAVAMLFAASSDGELAKVGESNGRLEYLLASEVASKGTRLITKVSKTRSHD